VTAFDRKHRANTLDDSHDEARTRGAAIGAPTKRNRRSSQATR